MKVQFIQSPSGKPWHLAHFAGDIVEMPDDLANELIESKMAKKYVDHSDEAVQKATSKGQRAAEKR